MALSVGDIPECLAACLGRLALVLQTTHMSLSLITVIQSNLRLGFALVHAAG